MRYTPTMLFFAFVTALTSAAPSPSDALGGDYWQGTGTASGQVWGVADLHAHFFNHLGFGGRVLHGSPSAPHGMREALSSCGHNHGQYAGKSTALLPEPSHRTSGFPLFAGWPRYDTIVHQQAYVDWVRRAWEGGVRLVQMDVQNTPLLGTVSALVNRLTLEGDPTPVPLDDASALELQTAAARTFFDGPASEFAAIAHTSAEARRIIESGKMAVVLGVEVEALDNLATEAQLGDDPAATIAQLAQTWVALRCCPRRASAWKRAPAREAMPCAVRGVSFARRPSRSGMGFAIARRWAHSTRGTSRTPARATTRPIRTRSSRAG